MTSLIVAIISAVTSIIVVFTTQYLMGVNNQRLENLKTQKILKEKYLFPLRFTLERFYFRNAKLIEMINSNDSESKEWLNVISNPSELSDKPAIWYTFDKSGYYHLSTCYIASCLFYQMNRLRNELPYLNLSNNSDSELIRHMYNITFGFLIENGVFNVVQETIGYNIYSEDKNRLLTYQEYCQLMKNSDSRVWHEKLIYLYIDIFKSKRMDQIEDIVAASLRMLDYIGEMLGEKSSISEQWVDETKFKSRKIS